MTANDTPTPPPSTTPAPANAPRPRVVPRTSTAGIWARVVVVCAVLAGSAYVRWNQAERIKAGLIQGRQAPSFNLSEVPSVLGPWKGIETKLDPTIARATGANQIVTRRYVNQDTGSTIDMILLYGPAVEMYVHAPEVCYPAAGYAQVAGPDLRPIPSGPSKTAPFKSLVYSKGEGGPGELQEVYYSWWYHGGWSPDVGKQKHFERIPSMYKVHLARRVTAGEKRDVGNPCESFLNELLPVMERTSPRPERRPPAPEAAAGGVEIIKGAPRAPKRPPASTPGRPPASRGHPGPRIAPKPRVEPSTRPKADHP